MAKKQRRFEFKGRSKEAMEERQKRLNNNGPSFDNWLNSSIPRLNTQEPQKYVLRILPPPQEYDPGHHGFDLWVHFGVGPNNQQYLCRDWMGKGDCPICEERSRAFDEGEKEYAKTLFPTRRVGVYIIDREHEDQGVQFWAMPVSVDKDLHKGMEDPVSGEVKLIDDPENGLDIAATREGKGINTNWSAGIAQRSTPLHEDEEKANQWLDFVLDNPIPEQLIFYDYERIKEVFEGGDQEEEDDTPQSFRQQSVESEDQPPAEEEVTQEQPESEPEPDPDPEPEPRVNEDNGTRRRRRNRTSGIAEQLKED